MLQQTQVATVIDYFMSFMTRFPDIEDLAEADLDEVLHQWTGLGYYARARNLHKTAKIVVENYAGKFPESVDALSKLPGIGRSTAGAIAAISYGHPTPILDGNVKRVLTRFHGIPGHPGQTKVEQVLWYHAEAHTPEDRSAQYTQAIMDLGATLCTRSNPNCLTCPMVHRCEAYATASVDQYPARKVSKDKPTKAARFFLFITPDGGCLLERRPPTGIWGGLWTPPERPADAVLGAAALEFGIMPVDIDRTVTGEAFRHTFTHFHLTIEPVYAMLRKAPLQVADNDEVLWHHPGNNTPIGLTKPAVTLLEGIPEILKQ